MVYELKSNDMISSTAIYIRKTDKKEDKGGSKSTLTTMNCL